VHERALAEGVVDGGKGGVGKSAVASTLSPVLADAGKRVGLLDWAFSRT
jgi:Mrp family chromosome partitioning ATPase